jgi:hypothetical protein
MFLINKNKNNRQKNDRKMINWLQAMIFKLATSMTLSDSKTDAIEI